MDTTEQSLRPTPAHDLAEAIFDAIVSTFDTSVGDAEIYDVDPWKSQFGVDVSGRRYRVDVVDVS